MEFGLLGPLTVRRGEADVRIAPGKQRVILAALLLSANRQVANEELQEILWGTAPPASARMTIQTYVMRLRNALGDADRGRIQTLPGGYLIEVATGELDVTQFEATAAEVLAAAGQGTWAVAAGRARAALALWRGQPLSGIGPEALAARLAPHLTELRLQVHEARIEADMHLGRHREAAAELQGLVTEHPLRERLHAMLMLALVRDGREGEALAAYQQARRALIEELGAEPGNALRELHQQILTGDPALAAGAPSPRADPPRQLPAAVTHFVGRRAELDALTALLDRPRGAGPGTVVISAIGGTAGVGKTALAIHWAHQVAPRFPDGQLYVNLRGYDPDQPVPAATALAQFLSALGMAGPDIPADTDQRAARYRSLLAGRRMLVVVDNARDAEHARPLLPGDSGCTVVVTSRDSMAGLVAQSGAGRLDLTALPLDDAVSLLGHLIGGRAGADRAAAVTLARQCACLPLVLRVAAELAAARPGVPLAVLSGELADSEQRLDLLDAGGDPRMAIRAVFSWSVRQLSPPDARLFRLLGLHPGPDTDRHAAAALAGLPPAQAGRALTQLARASLIQVAGPDRYALHDLLRGYAAGQCAEQDSAAERQAALAGLLDYYLRAAAAAMDALSPAERHLRPRVAPPAGTPVPSLPSPAAAQAWLDAERAVLVAVTDYAAGHGWPGHATRLAATLWRYLDTGGHYAEAVIVHSRARHAARAGADRAAEAAALANLGVTSWRQGRYPEAAGYLREALALCRQAGDRTGEARALSNLGGVTWQQGRYQEAAGHFGTALALCRQTGDRTGEARALGNLGIADWRQGRYQQAAAYLRQAIALFRETGDRTGGGRATANLGMVEDRLGLAAEAAGHFREALAVFRDPADRYGTAHALAGLGALEQRMGRYQQAASCHERALALFREIRDRSGEAEALNGLGEARRAAGQPEQAIARHAAALALAAQVGDQYQQARAHHGAALAQDAAGDPAAARRHWQEALARYAGLGTPEAAQARAALAGLVLRALTARARTPRARTPAARCCPAG